MYVDSALRILHLNRLVYAFYWKKAGNDSSFLLQFDFMQIANKADVHFYWLSRFSIIRKILF